MGMGLVVVSHVCNPSMKLLLGLSIFLFSPCSESFCFSVTKPVGPKRSIFGRVYSSVDVDKSEPDVTPESQHDSNDVVMDTFQPTQIPILGKFIKESEVQQMSATQLAFVG